ncbi:LysR substrate-binding domain-containing protein [Acuticoccus sp. M5D2P5]|uniref:LysR substrate-binding domain-containing protein n=1 Tax=Acuticoccus kalidii TaxID=2910977 RepID=UPI001F2F6BFA|nr:LysR substrate-binding domain-containing protein [Acuticoccus kalidii]MCF3936612.1 LysR substrate-binding domain-containing protein [Acuticoccus kalidii]
MHKPVSPPHERRIGFTLRELEVLRALVETGKTTTAAQRLGLSQPAVSRSLGQLEAQLGRQLFTREGGRLLPNEEALAIAEELGPVFTALQRIETRANHAPTSHSGALRVVAPPTIAHRFMPRRVARFTRENPELEVLFDVIASDILISAIAEENYDLGVIDTVPAHEGVRLEPLLATEAICALPRGHHLADKAVIRAQDLDGEPFIAATRRHSSRAAIDRVLERAGARPKFVIESSTTVATAEFVREGLGVALMNPFPIIHQLGRDIEVRPFLPVVPYRASFILPSGRPPSAAAMAFMSMVRASLDPSPYPSADR